ncbi:hypothetical protein Pan216_00550 [Planctomycetes bacterium Pan216]|uniref:Uncharacterized protein n=1 Tax=Kolteria novifilia TaxID=2527975 RepID=A0A518AWY4_9BACT|nr:hypothetical protein Pan216_00550 [Planctomycetes bacterium Pan216]
MKRESRFAPRIHYLRHFVDEEYCVLVPIDDLPQEERDRIRERLSDGLMRIKGNAVYIPLDAWDIIFGDALESFEPTPERLAIGPPPRPRRSLQGYWITLGYVGIGLGTLAAWKWLILPIVSPLVGMSFMS